MSDLVIVQDSMYPAKLYELVSAIEIADTRFERVRECELVLEFEGAICNDYRCTCCGKVHNAPRRNSYCPRCGAKVKEEQ